MRQPVYLKQLFFKRAGLYALLGVTVFLVSSCAIQGKGRFGGAFLPSEDPILSNPTPIESPPVNDNQEYLLGPEDVIEVLVWKDEALTRTVLIRPDGKISLPLIGEIQAEGSTPAEIAGIVKHRLQKYYKEPPEVSVIVTGVNSFSVFVLGEVGVPGKQILRRKTTLLQAISLAGGFKPFANTNGILLLRREGQDEKRIKIRYKDILKGSHPEWNYWLQQGDTIVVP